MSWDDIRYFLAVMRGGSLSAAARALQVQHSTVARRIDALESALGIRLFDRLPRGWPPTDEGLHLAEHAARIETDAHAFARAACARRRSTAWCAYRRRRCSPATSSRRGSPARSAHGRRCGSTCWARCTRRTCTHAKPISRCGCRGRPSRGRRAPARHDALRAVRVAGMGGRAARHLAVRRLRRRARANAAAPVARPLRCRAPFRVRHQRPAAQHRACAAGAGVALLPRFLVDEPAAHAGAPLVELTAAPRCDIEREIWLVVHPDVRRSPRVQRVADAIAEAVHAADGRL